MNLYDEFAQAVKDNDISGTLECFCNTLRKRRQDICFKTSITQDYLHSCYRDCY